MNPAPPAHADRARPIDLQGGEEGVLCLHGFTGTPYEVSFLATSLNRRGYTTVAPLLPGHGTDPRDLNRTTYQQWQQAVDDHVAALSARCDRVAIAGQSMGGLLALDAAMTRPNIVTAVVALATPLWLPGAGRVAAPVLRRLPRLVTQRLVALPKRDGSDVLDAQTKKDNPSYRVLPLSGVAELARLMHRVRTRLGRVRCPLLVIHGRNDHTAPPACADALISAAGSDDKELLMVPRSYHLVACDVERKQVAAAAAAFLHRTV